MERRKGPGPAFSRSPAGSGGAGGGVLPAMFVVFLLLFMIVLHFLLHSFVCHHSWCYHAKEPMDSQDTCQGQVVGMGRVGTWGWHPKDPGCGTR